MIARGIEESIERRDELVAAGHARAAKLSWTRTAAETLDAYEAASVRSV